jgi:hypothetical protein
MWSNSFETMYYVYVIFSCVIISLYQCMWVVGWLRIRLRIGRVDANFGLMI